MQQPKYYVVTPKFPNLESAKLDNCSLPMQNVKNRKIMDFDNMLATFGGFSDPETARRFQERLKQYASTFCCIDEQPNRIFYDLFFDIIPRTDRFNRPWTGVWEPLPGP